MALRKIWLNLNGADRMTICDPEKDTLADVIRRMGLTGTKLGCKAGQCGACSVLLDGKVVRSCARKIKNIPDYSKIVTIEGIGTPASLHPLQLAWMVYGGVQCGFCAPGFIVSAKGLLDENSHPSREDVRSWFQKHRNACRCTGYKPLVDAVMGAAKVLRGGMTMEELAFKIPENGRIYGTNVPRPAALAKVCGVCDYGDDIQLKMPADTLHLAVVQPDLSHAKIINLDYAEAEKMPGVVKIVTYKDIKGSNRITLGAPHPRSKVNGFERCILAEDKIFRRGDVVAVAVADSEAHARAAAKTVKIEYEQLPEYLNLLDAIAPDALQIHKEMPNLYIELPLLKGKDTRPIMESAQHVVEGSFYSTRQPHLVIEPDVIQAYWDENGCITIHCKNLFIQVPKFTIADGIGLPPEKIRGIQNPTGASFGYSFSPGGQAIVAACAMAVNKPVTLTMSYEEHQHFTGKRAPSYANAKMACDDDGKILAVEFDIAYDHGAYCELAEGLASKGIRFFGYPYFIPNARGLSRCAATNHSFATAYRGFGSTQVYTSSEGMIDMMAEKMGMDPFEFRYRNIARPGDTNLNSYPYKDYPMEAIMDKMKPMYDAAKERAKAESTPEKRRGVGIALGGYNVTGGPDHAEIALELNADGTITHFNSWSDQGQGADVGTLVHTHEALRPLGISIDQIKLVQNDTLLCPVTGPAASSRSHYMAGNATIIAANLLMDAMRKEDGSFRTYDEMKAENIPTKYVGVYDTSGQCIDLDPNTGAGDPTVEYTYGMFLAEVEVDVATGKTKVLGMTSVADVGVVGSKQAVDGQAYGGMMHAIGFALSENYEDLKKHTSLAGSGFPYIEDVPDKLESYYVETPRKYGPQGSSGCAEMFQSSPHVAVINAIHNAVGVRIYELPATPEKVKEAIKAKEQGKEIKPVKYFLGSDLHETLDEIGENPIKITDSASLIV
ncbi:molybdopterin-dependent aldehyde oxidoreductase [Candidatus Formimonas warabiya]|uniref:Aldehyde oxidoreductase n=1 Tax=Formimonas warabiya TaxID=1761012 RepID=A0A3G1KXF1_FORW1|nr:molybdopterin-dependent aldehyde oxidoreductase [Candidatus Formimonas warabiya]ATW27049.1 aldehyde oxidoreductase [Candidatus Formimonas warabiya]